MLGTPSLSIISDAEPFLCQKAGVLQIHLRSCANQFAYDGRAIFRRRLSSSFPVMTNILRKSTASITSPLKLQWRGNSTFQSSPLTSTHNASSSALQSSLGLLLRPSWRPKAQKAMAITVLPCVFLDYWVSRLRSEQQ